jgi:hypothetical protein
MDFITEPLVAHWIRGLVFIHHEVVSDFSVAFFRIEGNTSRPFGVLPK